VHISGTIEGHGLDQQTYNAMIRDGDSEVGHDHEVAGVVLERGPVEGVEVEYLHTADFATRSRARAQSEAACPRGAADAQAVQGEPPSPGTGGSPRPRRPSVARLGTCDGRQ